MSKDIFKYRDVEWSLPLLFQFEPVWGTIYNVITKSGYTKFCEGYRSYCEKTKATSHIEHKPGIITEVDWSGPPMKIINPDTAEVYKAYIVNYHFIY